MAELGGSALFGARFRENAARALLIPRARPGKRTPLWQQRLKSQALLEVARKYGEFPIILETYRECLRDVLDLTGLVELLTALHRRELSLIEVETATASPFASSLLFDYVATYMYEGDTPAAERRAAALSLDRDLLRELLGQEELRDLIDPGALDRVESDLQFISPERQATSRDTLHDILRTLGDLERRRGRRARTARAGRERDAARAPRRASGGSRPPRGRGALDRRRRRRPVPRRARRRAPGRTAGRVPARTCPMRSRAWPAATAPPTGRSRWPICGRAMGSTPPPRLAELERAGDLVRGELRPGRQRARVV